MTNDDVRFLHALLRLPAAVLIEGACNECSLAADALPTAVYIHEDLNVATCRPDKDKKCRLIGREPARS